jgi:hypothetical protein
MSDEDLTRAHAEALQHDIEVLEEKVIDETRRVAVRAAPILVGIVALLIAAWILGRKSRRDR